MTWWHVVKPGSMSWSSHTPSVHNLLTNTVSSFSIYITKTRNISVHIISKVYFIVFQTLTNIHVSLGFLPTAGWFYLLLVAVGCIKGNIHAIPASSSHDRRFYCAGFQLKSNICQIFVQTHHRIWFVARVSEILAWRHGLSAKALKSVSSWWSQFYCCYSCLLPQEVDIYSHALKLIHALGRSHSDVDLLVTKLLQYNRIYNLAVSTYISAS